MVKNVLICLLSTFYFLLPVFAAAHGTPYFQFLPDSYNTSSLNVLTSGTVSQIFMPQNEFFGGIDLWFSNGNSAASATLKLYNSVNTLLATRVISIPAIPDVAGGQRVHTDFTQISVTSTALYRVQIETGDSALRLHYAPRTTVLTHNAPAMSAYQNGAAKINNDEMDFSFLFALYENNETVPPVISNLTATVETPTAVRIYFNANEPVDYKVEYGLQGQGYTQTSPYGGTYDFCAQGVDTCSRLLTVAAGTAYNYRLTIKDSWGNLSTATGTFTTPLEGDETPAPTPAPSGSVSPTPGPDVTSPIISNFHVVLKTPSSIQVAWSTNEAADTQYTVWALPALIYVTGATDNTLELEHFVDSGNSLSGEQYRMRITSRDSAGNSSEETLDFNLPNGTPVPPTPSPSVPPPAPSSAPQTPTAYWYESTEATGGYRVDIFDSSNKLIKSVKLPAGSTNLPLSELNDGEYSVVVYASTSKVYKKAAAPQKITIDRRSFFEKLFTAKNLLLFVGIIALLVVTGIIVVRHRRATAAATPPPQTV